MASAKETTSKVNPSLVAAPVKKKAPIQQSKTAGVRKTISLNDWENPQEDANAGASSNLNKGEPTNENFTEAQLRDTWQEFVNDAIRNGDLRKTNILKGRAITIEDKKISIKLDNAIQSEHLNGFKEEMMQYLRGKIRNSGIILESTVVEANTENMLYTSDDKYKHLVKKHPSLEKLKQTLGLETGF